MTPPSRSGAPASPATLAAAISIALLGAGPGAAVTFDEALGLAARAPAVSGAAAAAAEQRRVADEVSSLVANPTLTVQPGAARDPLDGRIRPVNEATLLQGWNLSGLPGRREAAVRAEGQFLSAEARAAALSHRLAAAQGWLELWAAQQSLADSLQEHEIAREFAARVSRAAEAAASTRVEAADAASYAAEAHVQAIQVEGEVTDRGFALAAAMGQRARDPLAAAGPLPSPALPVRTDWPSLLAAAERLPAVAARRITGDAERARELELRASKGWALGTGVKVTRDYLGTWGAQAVLDVAFPLFDRGEREAAGPAAAAARARGEHEEAAAAAATELARALHDVEHTQEILDANERELLPAAAENARLREASMRAGETTVLEVLLARRVWAAARARHTRARAAHAWASVKVWLLLADLDTGAAAAPPGGKP
jgi:cobalt-zinc-cadmium efflux system outer membrane protein